MTQLSDSQLYKQNGVKAYCSNPILRFLEVPCHRLVIAPPNLLLLLCTPTQSIV